MLKNLIFSVTFASTGRQINGEHSFTDGMTVITGQNEQGKSLRIEMIRYAMFGTRALRAPLDAYKDLNVYLEIEVKGKVYRLRRTKHEASITDGDDVALVRGAKPVTDYVEQKILGYTVDVFDMTNACLQGQVENLMSKTPAERKKLVDKTIGLDVIDDVEKVVNEALSEFRGEVKALESQVVADLVAPKMPQDYTPSPVVQEKIAELKAAAAQYRALISQQAQLNKPAEVEAPTIDDKYKGGTEEDLTLVMEAMTSTQSMLEKDAALVGKVADLSRTLREVAPEKQNFKARYEAQEAWADYDKYQQAKSKIKETRETCEEALAYQAAYDQDQEAFMKKASVQNKIMKLEGGEKLCCPACNHTWSDDDELIQKLKGELSSIKCNNLTPPAQPQSYWKSQLTLIEALEESPAPEQPTADRESIEEIRADERALVQSQQLADLRDQVLPEDLRQLELERLAGYKEKFTALKTYQDQLRVFNRYLDQLRTYKETFDRLQLAITELTTLHSSGFDTNSLNELLLNALTYEKELHTYETLKAQSEVAKMKLDAVKAQMEDWENAKAGLKLVKPAVKTYLIPSLSKASSALVTQMTSGKRTKVEVDEDFNVKVDGQDVDELSGSAKAVTNLALRFGLGAVLTHGVFSVFLGDEIDAAMDAERVAATAECVRNLKANIKQIILVSHRNPESDHKVEL